MGMFKTDGKAILLVFVGAIITVVLLSSVANTIVGSTTTGEILNSTIVVPAVNATTDLTGRDLITETAIVNVTNGSQDLSGQGVYLQTGTGASGLRTVQITTNDTGSSLAGLSVNVSYTYNPDGYISDAGSRSITLLILIFGAVAIMLYVVFQFIKYGSLGKLMARS